MAGSKKKCSPTSATLTTAETIRVVKEVFKCDGSLSIMCDSGYLLDVLRAGQTLENLGHVTRSKNFHRNLLRMFELHRVHIGTTECVRRAVEETVLPDPRRTARIFQKIQTFECRHGRRGTTTDCLIANSISAGSSPWLLASTLADADAELVRAAEMHMLPIVLYDGSETWSFPKFTIVKSAVKASLFKGPQQDWEERLGKSLVDHVLGNRGESSGTKQQKVRR